MYMLMPQEPNIGFVTLAVIFVSATLLGFASHAPGGIGVFDAAMLVALWQFDKEELLAGLLLFRLLYYIVPFALSLLILGGRELLLAARGAPPPRIPRFLRWRRPRWKRRPERARPEGRGPLIGARRQSPSARGTSYSVVNDDGSEPRGRATAVVQRRARRR